MRALLQDLSYEGLATGPKLRGPMILDLRYEDPRRQGFNTGQASVPAWVSATEEQGPRNPLKTKETMWGGKWTIGHYVSSTLAAGRMECLFSMRM